jgi:hypothetical protein
MSAAGELAVKAHFDTSFDKMKRPMDERDRFDAPAIYMGWYRPNAYGMWRKPEVVGATRRDRVSSAQFFGGHGAFDLKKAG